MTGLRRSVLVLFALCTAFAAGVALGAGSLQRPQGPGSTAALVAGNAALSEKVATLEHGQVFASSVTAAAASDWLKGSLSGQTVTVFVLPGVGEEDVAGVRNAVRQAGGSTTVVAQVSADLVDPGRKTYVDSVSTSSSTGIADLPKTTSDDTYARIGALIARAYVGHSEDLLVDSEATKIASELQGSRLVQTEGTPQRRGALVIVLASGDHGADVDTQAAHLIETQLVTALARAGDGLVAVTPPTGTAPGGLLAALGQRPNASELPVSTLNVSDGAAADIAAVFALRAAAGARPGDFGVDGSRVILPPGMADQTG